MIVESDAASSSDGQASAIEQAKSAGMPSPACTYLSTHAPRRSELAMRARSRILCHGHRRHCATCDGPARGRRPPTSCSTNGRHRERRFEGRSRRQLEYKVWEEPGRLAPELPNFVSSQSCRSNRVDRDLAPTYPGITESENLRDWDPPFPIDLRRSRPVDEATGTYRTTPKAFPLVGRPGALALAVRVDYVGARGRRPAVDRRREEQYAAPARRSTRSRRASPYGTCGARG